jgi:hypothetical protein
VPQPRVAQRSFGTSAQRFVSLNLRERQHGAAIFGAGQRKCGREWPRDWERASEQLQVEAMTRCECMGDNAQVECDPNGLPRNEWKWRLLGAIGKVQHPLRHHADGAIWSHIAKARNDRTLAAIWSDAKAQLWSTTDQQLLGQRLARPDRGALRSRCSSGYRFKLSHILSQIVGEPDGWRSPAEAEWP